MSLTATKKLASTITAGILAAITLATVSTASIAETSESSRSSKSISFVNNTEIDKATKDEQLKQAEADVMTPLLKQGFREESLPAGIHTDSISYSSGEITVFETSTDLISDFDFDGFYHRFSVSIDADTIHEVSYVYARLYLSYEGGPWNHYATSNNYHIYGDSAEDAFVIETELADGFPPGYYDVRIELYDADHGDWLVSYGPYDNASLSTLPLEDSYHDDDYHDDIYFETGIAVSAGSMGWWLLIAPALIALGRLVSWQQIKHRIA